MAKDKIFFASDLHLGSTVMGDPLVREKRFVGWLDSIKEEAKAIYLMGDIFDFWFEYKKVIPKGFSRFLGKLAELSDAGIEIHFFTGNHDVWAFDYLPKEMGVIVHREPLITELYDKNFYLAHGDGLGDSSLSFRIIRAIFHNKVCQFLFTILPTNWGISFAHWWSSHNREKDIEESSDYLGEDKEHLVLFAKDYLKKHPGINFFVFGHRHIMLDLQIEKQSRVVILGDWLEHFSYAVYDGETLSLETVDF